MQQEEDSNTGFQSPLRIVSTFIGDRPAEEGETEVMCRAGDAVKKIIHLICNLADLRISLHRESPD